MERVNHILRHDLFTENLKRLNGIEKDTDFFCRHGMEHFLDAARIAWTLYLESPCDSGFEVQNPGYIKEMIYAAAMLHDIGRARQYEDKTPHEQESARIAANVLPDCGFDKTEIELILDAILSHRTRSGGGKPGLAGLLYRADKLSRLCFLCSASGECDWDMKNERMEY